MIRQWADDSAVVGAERVADPAQGRGRAALQFDDIEAAGAVRQVRVGDQEQFRGEHQATALADIDGGGTASECGATPLADLDEDDAARVVHHQVQLAATHVEIAGQQLQAGCLQVGAGGVFAGLPPTSCVSCHLRQAADGRR